MLSLLSLTKSQTLSITYKTIQIFFKYKYNVFEQLVGRHLLSGQGWIKKQAMIALQGMADNKVY